MNKILIVHTNYQNIGGEDIAVNNEIEFLSRYYEVETLIYSNNIKKYFSQSISFILNSNFESNKKMKEKLDAFKPDIVYIHNTWFMASLGIFNTLLNYNVKIILKLHNFRYFCTKNYFSRHHFLQNNICGACGLNKKSIGIFNKYFGDSFIKSFLVIRYGKRYFYYLKNFDMKLLVLTKFHQKFLENLGVDKNKIFHIPNYLNIKNGKNNKQDNSILYAGRISKEKGVDKLIESFIASELKNWKLKIIGDGPLLSNLIKKYSMREIEFLGKKNNNEVLDLISQSRAVVTATTLYEGQPTLLCEASNLGIASIFPRSGGIEEFFPKNYELSFEKNNTIDLIEKFNLLKNQKNIEKIGNENKKFINDYLNEILIINDFKKIFIND